MALGIFGPVFRRGAKLRLATNNNNNKNEENSFVR